jgi:hypothetical protein
MLSSHRTELLCSWHVPLEPPERVNCARQQEYAVAFVSTALLTDVGLLSTWKDNDRGNTIDHKTPHESAKGA